MWWRGVGARAGVRWWITRGAPSRGISMKQELERLGAVLDRHREEYPWHAAALRLLTFTGARLSEVLNLR